MSNQEDLKCCGNCAQRVSTDMGLTHEEVCCLRQNTASFMYCDKWSYDGLHRELRKKEYEL